MGWAAKERPAGPPAEPGSIRRTETKRRTCASTLRPGAAGLEGSVAHPNTGVPTLGAIGPAPALARSPQVRKSVNPPMRISCPTHRAAPAVPQASHPRGDRPARRRAHGPVGQPSPCLPVKGRVPRGTTKLAPPVRRLAAGSVRSSTIRAHLRGVAGQAVQKLIRLIRRHQHSDARLTPLASVARHRRHLLHGGC